MDYLLAIVGLFAAGTFLAFAIATLYLRAPYLRRRWPRVHIWHLCVVTLVAALLVGGPWEVVGNAIVLSLTVTAIAFAVQWIRAISFVMKERDDAFPGRHDKLVWIGLLVLFAPAAVWAFHCYRKVYLPEPEHVEEARTVGSVAAEPA